MGDYEFYCNDIEKAQEWKREIQTRVERSKLIRSSIRESEKYKESFAYIKDSMNLGRAHPKETEAINV